MKNATRFRTQFDPNYKGTKYMPEGGMGISLTVPDLNLSVKQLMERHTRGIGIGVAQREEHYFEDEEVPKMTDLTDLEIRREQLKQREAEIREEIKNQVLAHQKKEAAKLEKARQETLAAQAKKSEETKTKKDPE